MQCTAFIILIRHAAIRIDNLTVGNYNLGANIAPDDKRRNTSHSKYGAFEKTSLKVAEANSKDVRRRTARIDPINKQ